MKRLVISLLSLAFLISACTAPGSTPSDQSTLSLLPSPTTVTSPTVASPTVEPARITPPGATMTVDGQTQEAGVGSYCWITNDGNASTTTCAETAGVPTAREPLVIV